MTIPSEIFLENSSSFHYCVILYSLISDYDDGGKVAVEEKRKF